MPASKDILKNLPEIQGNILGGFNKDHQVFLFLRFVDTAQAKKWLLSIAGEVASAEEVRQFGELFKATNRRRGGELGILKATWTNIAFTHSGLKKLGVPDPDLNKFPDDYKQGMAARAAALGDVGPNAPDKWLKPLGVTGDNGVHALMIVASDDQIGLGEHVQRYLHNISVNGGVELAYLQEGAVRQDQPGHEHFGFRDGVSQPAVRHLDEHKPGAEPIQANPGQDRLHAGEFVLGYPTQIGADKTDCKDAAGNPLLDKKGKPVTIAPNPDEGPPSGQNEPTWALNGSYLVFRRLKQDVEAFQKHLEQQAAAINLSPDVLGAKLVGRYASGAPLELTHDEEDLIKSGALPANFDPTQGDPSVIFPDQLGAHKDANGNWTNVDSIAESSLRDNHFEYGDDLDGLIVPRAAHIRKAYPRDEPTPGGGESSTQTHRIMRRGIPFGTSFRPDLGATGHSGKRGVEPPEDRGLLFLCYQSSIEGQFEFIQENWVNFEAFPGDNGSLKNADGSRDGEDPIIAQSAQGSFKLILKNGSTQNSHILMMKHFVTTTGGDYFFQPSISALYHLGGGAPPVSPPKPDDKDDADREGFDICEWALRDANAKIDAAPKAGAPGAAPVAAAP